MRLAVLTVIERLDIENIKSFAGRQEAELAPITLIYGPNSSGKSTLLQSLAVLKQTIEPLTGRGDLEEPPLVLHGDLVDLGSFSTCVHGHDLDRSISIGVRFQDRTDMPRGRILKSRPVYASLTFGYDHKREVAVQTTATLGDDDNKVQFVPRPTARSSPFAGWGKTFRLDRASAPALLNLAVDRVNANAGASGDDARHVSKIWEQLVKSISTRLDESKQIHFYGPGLFPVIPDPELVTAPDEALPINAFQVFDELWGIRDRALTELLAGLAYLGPLRAAPRRFETVSNELPRNVGRSGQYTSVLLSRDPDLRDEVNMWLSRLDIDYQLSVKEVKSADIGVELGDLLATSLTDSRTGLGVTPQDVGFGISQLLPVVVQMIVGNRKTVCVEQPEIHIHPRLQAEIGDLLIEAAGPSRSNQVIVETHSEHLMLRLQRRLREGTYDWLKPRHIAVLYVDRDQAGATSVQRLRLDEQGFFEDPWPAGFFPERLYEVMGD